MSIRDFFKPKAVSRSASEETLTPALNEPKKSNLISLDSEDEPRVFAASKATKSNSSSPRKGGPKRSTAFVIEDSESDADLFNSLPDTLEEFIPETKTTTVKAVASKKASPKKTKKLDDDFVALESHDDEDFEDEEESPKKKKRAAAKPKAVIEAKKPKSESVESSNAATDAEETPKKKFNYYAYMAKKSSAPVAAGSKEIPEGSPNCLEGLAFVFTGELSSISRDDATDLVKRYGARVTTAPSGKTDYVVVGENAGGSKLEKIQKLNLKTLDEDGLFDLIRSKSVGFKSGNDVKTSEPKAIVKETEKVEPVITTEVKKEPQRKVAVDVNLNVGEDLWTVKWAPKKPEDLIGNHSIYEKLKGWLTEWKSGPPKEFKAVLLSGPPGIGKTTMAHMACKEAGYDIVEMNASDTRNKKTLHDEVRDVINNTSLGSFFQPAKVHTLKKQCIIMDECDGMSAGDRGGMAELIQLIKKTKVPIICACNDRSSPKVRSLANYCLDLRFRRPEARQVVPRLTEICRQEGLKVSLNTIEELVASTQGDIRQILTLLSTYRLTHDTLDYDDSKKLGQASKKDIEEGPFDALHTLLSGSASSRLNLGQKIDLYFVDNGLMPLMIQENYLKSRAMTPRTVYDPIYGNSNGSNANFTTLTWAAADSISKADEVDALIRGYNQEWSLAPLHAVLSCVRPAYFCSGNLSGRVDFAGWLGQNSKQQKYLRILKELTQHLYMNTRANKLTLCLDYAPTMAGVLMNRLQQSGPEGVEKAIQFLDDYSIAKEDVEPLLEIVLDPACNAQAYSKLPTTIKSAFTRKYNQGSHLLPYALGTSVPVRKIKTDISEGNDEENENENDVENENENDAGEDEDVSKDKMIKSKATSATTTKAKRGGKK